MHKAVEGNWKGGGRGTVVFEREEKSAGGCAKDVVWDYVAIFPGDVLDVRENWVAFLLGGAKLRRVSL